MTVSTSGILFPYLSFIFFRTTGWDRSKSLSFCNFPSCTPAALSWIFQIKLRATWQQSVAIPGISQSGHALRWELDGSQVLDQRSRSKRRDSQDRECELFLAKACIRGRSLANRSSGICLNHSGGCACYLDHSGNRCHSRVIRNRRICS